MDLAMLGIGSRMPVTSEELALPLHCKKVPQMNVKKLLGAHPELHDVARAISDLRGDFLDIKLDNTSGIASPQNALLRGDGHLRADTIPSIARSITYRWVNNPKGFSLLTGKV